MAVDTADKRSSAINVSSPWRGVLPIPDGVVALDDRQVVPFMYSGIDASTSGGAPLRRYWLGDAFFG